VEQRSTAIVRSLAPTGEAAFEQLFKTHFRGLHAYAITILIRVQNFLLLKTF
jgi:RNA polymerase sigma-70 factor (ECF subfamily)